MSQTKQPTNTGALSTLIVVFFFWGFIASSNSVFIPFCKHKFNLDQFQSQLVDFAFYLAYYIGALGLFAYGAFGGKDLYQTIEEKAAHLLYFMVKNHPFVDGNKRSGAFSFIWFLKTKNKKKTILFFLKISRDWFRVF
jgi:hypothetical protein